MECQRRVRFLVVAIKYDEFAVLCHDAVHLAWVVDDHRSAEAGILVRVHADVGVVCEKLAVGARIWCRRRRN